MISPDALLSGPRGRRLLLAFALASDQLANPAFDESSFAAAVFYASHERDPGRGTSRKIMRIREDGLASDDPADLPSFSDDDVANRLRDVALMPVTPLRLQDALAHAVDNARYWEPPDGEDNLAATCPMRAALQRVAEHIAQSPHVSWWSRDMVPGDQWSIQWQSSPGFEQAPISEAEYRAWRDEQIEGEAIARQQLQKFTDLSGVWWSIPILSLPRTTSSTGDGSPVGLWFVEDRGNEDRAIDRRYIVAANARIFEIHSADDWAELCRRYPLEVTHQRQPDWYRATGRHGRWLMPDWSAVAQAYGGVHLTVGAYLAAAGTAIPVDKHAASVIAGWNPDETWWLTPAITIGEPEMWVPDAQGDRQTWRPEP